MATKPPTSLAFTNKQGSLFESEVSLAQFAKKCVWIILNPHDAPVRTPERPENSCHNNPTTHVDAIGYVIMIQYWYVIYGSYTEVLRGSVLNWEYHGVPQIIQVMDNQDWLGNPPLTPPCQTMPPGHRVGLQALMQDLLSFSERFFTSSDRNPHETPKMGGHWQVRTYFPGIDPGYPMLPQVPIVSGLRNDKNVLEIGESRAARLSKPRAPQLSDRSKRRRRCTSRLAASEARQQWNMPIPIF